MRLPFFALFLLPALAVLGQPVVGPEVLSDPLKPVIINYPVAAPGVAMAKDRTGVVIAWMMPNAAGVTRIFVARLDATAHIAGGVREIPTASTVSGIDAVYPSVAASVAGDGFTLAWTEIISQPPLYTEQAVYCQLGPELQPSRPQVFLESTSVPAPAIVRSGRTKTWLTVRGLVWELKGDGSTVGPLDGGVVAGDMTIATDYPQVVGSQRTVVGFTCNPIVTCAPQSHFGCLQGCRTNRDATNFTFTALYKTSVALPMSFDSFAQPALQTDRHDVLLAWYDGEQTTGGSVRAARIDPQFFDVRSAVKASQSIGTFGPDSGQTRPDIATDGQRYVVVWRTTASDGTHDIVGASLDGSGNVTSFSVATSSADEIDPSVIAVGNGTFLVAYQTLSDGVRRIAGRYLTFNSRPRTVR